MAQNHYNTNIWPHVIAEGPEFAPRNQRQPPRVQRSTFNTFSVHTLRTRTPPGKTEEVQYTSILIALSNSYRMNNPKSMVSV
jgi:hypothetical protein